MGLPICNETVDMWVFPVDIPHPYFRHKAIIRLAEAGAYSADQ